MLRRAPLLFLFLLAVAGTARAEGLSAATRCARGTAAPPAGETGKRKYAPDRLVDLLHLALDLTPDFQRRTIRGEATFKFKPIARPLRELRLDAERLDVQSVHASAGIRAWQNTDRELIATFDSEVPADQEVTLTVRYRAEPTEGLYFRTAELGYPAGDTHLFTQGEAILSRHWFPCLDTPNEKFTSEVTCRVPDGMTAISNGRLVAEIPDPTTGLVAFHWRQDEPHVTYLIALAAGHFRQLEARHREIPVTFHTPPSSFAQAEGSFRGTLDMLAFFERETGVPYPWAKYAQVCVADFVAGGMENTSLTILNDNTLFPAEVGNLRSSEGLVAHELAHQWFGDLVTCKDWSHLWLNEGFATYYEALYDGERYGRDQFLYNLYGKAREVLDQPRDPTPIVWREFDHPDAQFGYRAYPKGAWVLHMLRSQLGDDLYRRCIRTYLERHRFDTVVTEDLNAVVEELSGRSFDAFFDQWVYHGHYPELEVSYAWDEATRLARLTVRQVQATDDRVLLFRFPLPVRFRLKDGVVDRPLEVRHRQEEFYVALPEAPQAVRIDPDLTVLARVRFTPPTPLLMAQLTDPTDAMGRLFAVIELGQRRDQDSLTRLRQALETDAFYGVRLEAAKALAAWHTPEALEALLASTHQPDARVRQQVLRDVGGFYRDSALAAVRAALEAETNLDIRCDLLRALGNASDAGVPDTLVRQLKTDSFRNALADAAIEAMRRLANPTFVAPLLETLGERPAQFTSGGFASGLRTLAFLARDQEDKTAVRAFLLRQLAHPRADVRTAAISALGTLGDPQAVGPLETFAHATRPNPEREAAQRAVADLRARRRPAEELGTLRGEVLALQQANRDLRRELDDLKQRLEALAPPLPARDARKTKRK